MKKIFMLFCVICFVLISNSSLLAGAVDNRSNMSAEYIRSLNRNAATDSLDAIVYNPAGVMKMEDGTYLNISNHFVTKDYTNTVDGVALEQDVPSNIPALFALYKRGQWAGFFSFTIPAGGGTVEFNNGSATTRIGATTVSNLINLQALGMGAPGPVYGSATNERLEGSSVYFGYTVGGAYEVDENISFSMAFRYISAVKELNASFSLDPTAIGQALSMPTRDAVLDYEEDAQGIGVIFGMNIDYESFNIGVKFESETDLDFKYEVNADAITGLPAGLGASMGVINGREHARNLPALLAVGVGYEFTPKVRMDVNLTSYFQEDADWGGLQNYTANAWEGGIAFEYIVNPDLKLSAGYLHTDIGVHVSNSLKEAPELDANTFGAGLAYNWSEKLKIECGIGIVNYDSDSYTDYSSGTPLVIGLEKDVMFLSIGGEYRF